MREAKISMSCIYLYSTVFIYFSARMFFSYFLLYSPLFQTYLSDAVFLMSLRSLKYEVLRAFKYLSNGSLLDSANVIRMKWYPVF